LLNYLALPWFPLNNQFPRRFWDARSMANPKLYYALAPIVIACLIWTFRRSPRLLAMMGSLLLVGFLFNHLVYDGSLRHFGIVFIGFVAGVWMLRSAGRAVPVTAYLLLGLNSIAGGAAAYGQWAHPFVDDAAVVAWLKTQGLENAALIGTPDTHVVGVAERLHRSMYFLDCSCVDSYMKFSNRRDHFDADHAMPEKLAEAVHDLHAPAMILMMNRTVSATEEGQLRALSIEAQPLAEFRQGDLADEQFYLYKVGLAAAAQKPVGR
jgi:hypothetical protein